VEPDVRRELEARVGSAHVLHGDTTEGPATDWTGRYRGRTPAIVRPGTVDEVAAVLAVCDAAGVPVVPQGGNTGLVGGGVPLAGEVVLSLRRLERLGPVDQVTRQVTAGSGVTLSRLQAHAAEQGLRYAVDLAARETATVGGTVATNAGGSRFLRFGGTREQLRGIEAVLADGRVVRHLGGLEKDNTGYHLPSLLCGSEGTLAVVTAARLALVPEPTHHVTALLGCPGVAAALEVGVSLRERLPELEAAELFLDEGLRLVVDRLALDDPFPDRWPAYLLVECADDRDPTERLAAAIEATSVGDVAVGVAAGRREALWRYREGHTEAMNLLGIPHKLDVTLPLGQLAAFAEEVVRRVRDLDADAHCWLFGHVLDGNLHVNVTGLTPGDNRVDEAVLTLVADHGGSISAEHGIGTAKKAWLHLSRSPVELDVFRAVKRALDPRGILNPNVLLP
jgi:FAD/FMN-containing dehydrogenase